MSQIQSKGPIVPLQRSLSAPTPLTTAPAPKSTPETPKLAKASSSQQQRQESVQQSQQLVSPEVPQKVGKQVSSLPVSHLQQNGQQHQDLLSSLKPPKLGTFLSKPELTKISSDFTPKNQKGIARPNHVINTHIMQKAVDTPQISALKAQQRDLRVQLDSLTRRQESLADFINEMAGVETPTKEQSEALASAKKDVQIVEHQLKGALKQMDDVGKELETAISQLPQEDHAHTVWEKVKSTYIESSDTKSSLFMTAAIDYRRQVMDSLVTEVSQEMGLTPLENNSKTVTGGQESRIKSVGSTAQTSDRDITVATRGGTEIGKDRELVAKVNQLFRERFGQDSGSFFDTNLYNEGLMPDVEKIKNEQPVDSWSNPKAKQLNQDLQDVVSLAKQRGFFSSPDEWSAHTETMLSQLKDMGGTETEISELRNKYKQANEFVVSADQMITDRATKLQAKFPSASDTEIRLMASNELYIEHVKVADEAMKATGGDENKIADARFKMGLAHYFANEAGMSEGVLRDVVINGQEIPNTINPERAKEGKGPLKPLDLSSQQLLQSFNENLGETLKEFNHYSGNLQDGAIHASKYLGRLARGLDQMATKAGIDPDNPTLQGMKELNTKILKAERGIEIQVGDKTIKAGLLDLRKNEKIAELAQHFGVPNDASDLEGTKRAIAQKILEASGLGDLTSTGDFRTLIKDMGQKANALIRSKQLGH